MLNTYYPLLDTIRDKPPTSCPPAAAYKKKEKTLHSVFSQSTLMHITWIYTGIP